MIAAGFILVIFSALALLGSQLWAEFGSGRQRTVRLLGIYLALLAIFMVLVDIAHKIG